MTRIVSPRIAGALMVATAYMAFLPGASVAAPGDLDPTFGTGGATVVDEGVYESAYGMTLQPDGKIIGVGVTTAGPNQDALVFRLNPDGSPDVPFGNRRLDGPGGASESAAAAAVQPDGKIVVAGRTSKNYDSAVWRLLPTGELDPSFGGGDGLATIDSLAEEHLSDVAITPDGRIVAVGLTTTSGGLAAIYRLTSTGELDSTFDTDGQLGIGGAQSFATGVAVQPDSKIVITGRFTPSGAGMLVRRLTPAGAIDPTFGGGDGEAHTGGVNGYGHDVALQPDGRIVVVGSAPGTTDTDGAVVRYTATGSPDTSFGGAGVARIDLGGYEDLRDVALTPSGSVVASGYTDAGDDDIVAKFRADGTPDTTFGPRGVLALHGGIEYLEDIAAQPDGKIVVVGGDGKSTPSAVVNRLLGDYRTPPPPTATPMCQGRTATIVGTAGKDRISGTRKADVVVALGGNDVVKGRGGNDLVCAGDGNDTVTGGPGKDTLRGEQGKDRLAGGAGKDKLVGGPQQDVVTQ